MNKNLHVAKTRRCCCSFNVAFVRHDEQGADLPFKEHAFMRKCRNITAEEDLIRRGPVEGQQRRSEPGPAPGPSAPQKQLLLKGIKPTVAVLKFPSFRWRCHADGVQPERLF